MSQEDNQSALPIGSTLQEYKIESILGAGAFGMTYLALDTHLDKKVVIKEYLPNDLAVRIESSTVVPKSNLDNDNYLWGLDRFSLEARVLGKFNHPNIVRINRFFNDNNTSYFVMDFERGMDLDAYLKSHGGKLNEEEIYNIIMPILDGLREVHSKDYLHRDLKPANIFIRDSGSPMLIDFGASRIAVGSKTQSLTTILTEGYAPKEQYSSTSKQGAYTDIYAIGAVMYKMATGKIPTESSARVDLTSDGELDPYQKLQYQKSLPYGENFKIAVDWALSLSARDRPQSVKEFQNALMGAVASGGTVIEEAEKIEETVEIEEKKGWSWLGFFFGPYYYAGYGKTLTAFLMGLFTLVPFVGLVIAVYAGLNAKKELPIGKQKFKWADTIVLIVFMVIVITLYTLSKR